MAPSIQLSKKTADKLKRRASLASIGLAATLSVLKLFAALVSGSLAVLSSMIDSLSDILGSFITFIAVKYSARPASEHHRYGYGKAEAVSALIQAMFIAGSGIFVIYDACSRFLMPRQIEQTTMALAVMCISLLGTIILITYQKYVATVTGSQAINADSEHYVVDVLTNASIIISLTVVKFFDLIWLDTVTAFAISAYLLFNAYQLAKDAVGMLLDRELNDDIRQDVSQIIAEHNFVKGFHDLRTRDLGGTYMFEIHLELDGRLSLYETHKLSEQVEQSILAKYPNTQIIIHQDPAGIEEDRLDTKLSAKK